MDSVVFAKVVLVLLRGGVGSVKHHQGLELFMCKVAERFVGPDDNCMLTHCDINDRFKRYCFLGTETPASAASILRHGYGSRKSHSNVAGMAMFPLITVVIRVFGD